MWWATRMWAARMSNVVRKYGGPNLLGISAHSIWERSILFARSLFNTRRKCKFSFVIKSCSGIRYHCCRCHFTLLRAIHDAYVQVERSYAPTPRIFPLLTGAQRHHFQMVWFEFEGIAWYSRHMCSTCVLSVILSSSKKDMFPNKILHCMI